MSIERPVFRCAQIGFGVLLLLGGLAVVALGAGWIASPPGYLKAPRWVLGAAGATFMLGGLLMVAPNSDKSALGAFLGALMMTLFGMVSNWVALGAGERRFSGAVASTAGVVSTGVGETVGRAALGVGAIILIAFAACAWLRWLRIWRAREQHSG